MTLEETKKILMTANALFPQWKVENPTETVQAWHWALEEYPAELVMSALQIFVKTSNSAFAPSPSELIECMHKVNETTQLSEGEAWALVKKAIADGNYHSEERFNELPETVQQAVGGHQMIRQWAMCSTEDVNTVIMSNFQRSYKAIVSRENTKNRIPDPLYELAKGLADKLSGERLISGS